MRPSKCEVIPEETDNADSKDLMEDRDSAPLLVSSPVTVEVPVPEPPARKASNHWVRKPEWSLGAPKGFIINDPKYSPSLSAASRQHLRLASAGLPRPDGGPFPGLCALVAACLHHTRSQDERSHADHRAPHGTRGHSGAQTGKGTWVRPRRSLI